MKRVTMMMGFFVLNGCMSIPVSTMMKMAGMDESTYLLVEPADLRIRITSDSDDPLVLPNTALTLGGEKRSGEKIQLGGALLLESEQDFHPERGTFSFGYQPEHEYVLRLNDEAVASFKEIQGWMKAKQLKSLKLGFEYELEGTQKSCLIIDMMLYRSEGYFTLFDKVDFPVESSG